MFRTSKRQLTSVRGRCHSVDEGLGIAHEDLDFIQIGTVFDAVLRPDLHQRKILLRRGVLSVLVASIACIASILVVRQVVRLRGGLARRRCRRRRCGLLRRLF